MEDISSEILGALASDESILWAGKPADISVLDAQYKKKTITKAVISSLIGIVLCILYFVGTAKANTELKLGFVAIILIFTVWAAVSDWLDVSKIRKMQYVLTNKRVICFTDSIRSAGYGEIKKHSFKTDAAGNTSLLMGSKSDKLKVTKWRGRCRTPFLRSENGILECAVLYAIPDSVTFQQIFNQQLENQK